MLAHHVIDTHFEPSFLHSNGIQSCPVTLRAMWYGPCSGGTYGEDVVFIANDWHAGLVPLLVASKYRPHGTFNNARSITAIHNILHQGVEPHTTFGNLGVPGEWYKVRRCRLTLSNQH
jgi:hypothetical protein